MSRPGAEAWFTGLGYVDDTPVMRFESKTDAGNSRLELLVPGMQGMEQRDWDWETRIYKKIAQAFRENLRILPASYNQSDSGSHTYQGLCGCDLRPDGSIRQYMQQAYDGEDFFFLNEELSWTYRDQAAWITHRRWDKTFENKDWKACMMNHTCKCWLHRYLEKGKETLLRTEITLTWQLDGEDQIQNMELVETRPAGDGTFQKWAAVVVPSGEEQRYTCRVQHEALPKPLTLRWEVASTSHLGTVIGMSVFVLGLPVFGVVIRRKKSSGRDGENALKIKGYDWMYFPRQGGRSREKELGRRWARGGFRVRTAHAGRPGRRVHVRRKARSRARPARPRARQ
ncbi:class I histocompatibility antigen, Gogo-B*0102 alpha chain-like [Rhynchocyon petersi]